MVPKHVLEFPPKIGSVIGNLLGKGHDDVGTKQASNAIVIASG